MTKTITVNFDKNGNPKIRTSGFKGKACAREIEEIVHSVKETSGVEIITDTLDYTSDYYAAEEKEQIRQSA